MKNNNLFVIGTHNGIFHSDEIVAISLLKILLNDIKEIEIIRSRDLNLLKEKCDILIDIGGGKFDHHQKGGNGVRTNGISYASAGLIWKSFGEFIIEKITNNPIKKAEIKQIFEEIDKNVIENIDAEDNGIYLNKANMFEYINNYLPPWNAKEINYDDNFKLALEQTTNILYHTLTYHIANILGIKEIERRILDKKTMLENVLLIPSQTIPWLKTVIKYNNNGARIDFVVFPYPDGGFALQCVPLSLENKFSQRIPLPEIWAGETVNLAKISNIETAILCHKGRFFARAKQLNDILKMAKVSTFTYEKENSKKLRKKNNDLLQ